MDAGIQRDNLLRALNDSHWRSTTKRTLPSSLLRDAPSSALDLVEESGIEGWVANANVTVRPPTRAGFNAFCTLHPRRVVCRDARGLFFTEFALVADHK
jgi:hypothetical protein